MRLIKHLQKDESRRKTAERFFFSLSLLPYAAEAGCCQEGLSPALKLSPDYGETTNKNEKGLQINSFGNTVETTPPSLVVCVS